MEHKVAGFNPTRAELDYFRRNCIKILLPNGMHTEPIPALNVLAAILHVLTPDQKRQVFEICMRTGTKPFVFGSQLTVPDYAKGAVNGT